MLIVRCKNQFSDSFKFDSLKKIFYSNSTKGFISSVISIWGFERSCRIAETEAKGEEQWL